MTGISIAARKAKGRKLQQTVRDAILAAFPELEAGDCQSCPMGSNGADIILSPAGKKVVGFDIECKARAKIGLVYDALEQRKREPGRTPIAVVKADRKRPLVVIDLDDFMGLITSGLRSG